MTTPNYIHFDDLTVSLLQLRVWHGEKEIHFTLSELRVLLTLLSEPHRTFSREELIQLADLTSTAALWTLISRIRDLLGKQYIYTVRGGAGYSFVPPQRAADTVIRNNGELS